MLWNDTCRNSEAWLEAADAAADLAKDGRTLVVLHSIPSGIAGVARYLPPDTPVATWVPGLDVRKGAQDFLQITSGYDRLAIVATHTVIDRQLPSPWFGQYFTQVDRPVFFRSVFLQEFRRNRQPATAATTHSTDRSAISIDGFAVRPGGELDHRHFADRGVAQSPSLLRLEPQHHVVQAGPCHSDK
jgi:hypothetical protein